MNAMEPTGTLQTANLKTEFPSVQFDSLAAMGAHEHPLFDKLL